MPVTASGLNATTTSATSQTVIASSAYNSNISALNGALNPTFQTLGVAGASTLDNGAVTTDGAGNIVGVTLSLSGEEILSKNSGSGLNDILAFVPADDTGFKGVFRVSNNDFLMFDKVNANEIIRWRNNQGGLRISGVGNFVLAWSRFTGTGSGTFNHGLGMTPNVVLPVQSTAGSQTMGWDTPTSTQVHITTGAGAAWVALALLTA